MHPASRKIAAANIPSITALRKELGYGDPRLHRCSAFYDDIRVFRKKYTTRKGQPGVSLYDWKSPEHQRALTEMAHDYLETDGNGLLYWPDDPAALNYNTIHYSEHSQL